MKCRRVQPRLLDFSFGRLEAAVAAHLERCADNDYFERGIERNIKRCQRPCRYTFSKRQGSPESRGSRRISGRR